MDSVQWPRNVIKKVQNVNEEAAISRDQDGLTPIMRAVQVGGIDTVKILDELNPEASKIVDINGQTLWHKLVNQPSYMIEKFVNDIGKKYHLIDLFKIQNKEGKTPLHLALESRCFTHARLFLQCAPDEWSSTKRSEWMIKLLEIQDGDGITSGDRLSSISDLPQDFVELLRRHALVVGIRSIWGVPTSQISEYANTMGVVAALITTITFTAAFTVPGGLVQDKGSPIFIRKAAFQAFMISDILAMCLSMMVLFCLLWVVATTDKRKSVVLIDFSMFLLLLAFYATLVTFMTGVYVTTIHDNPWIAIITLILCSLLMLLMHKKFVMNCLVPAVEVGLRSGWMKWPKVRSMGNSNHHQRHQ
ncbi:protein ACCELERATED CELL DEATH 6-like [Chenopodium quinoa]|uniref:protein ACCELERATED CELL DEATH 6-like n=1 Tax=Chenopodium quinoa TaxID=63459 RepID=UPI000B7860EA|nr:protein ACCELERATED CELL DEATH 6-like [Chenopodium quinoa]